MRSILIIIVTYLLFSFSPQNQNKPAIENGKTIFSENCVRCHGVDGTKGKWGAKNLKQSKLSDPALVNIISTGKGWMPSWKNKLSEKEIVAVVDYVKTLRHSK